jgi:hypothetical protein
MNNIAAWLPLILGQYDDSPRRMSLLQWAFMSLGWFYTLVLLLAGLTIFVGAVIVVIAARRPGVIAAYLALVPLPLIIGVWATVEGMIQSWSVIAYSTTAPKPSEMAQGYSTALFAILAGLLMTMPGYLVTAVGLLVRTALHEPSSRK